MSLPTDIAGRIRSVNDALLSRGQTDLVPEFFASDYVVHLADRDFHGHAFIVTFVNQLRSAFPDLAIEVEVLVEDGGRVAWRRKYRGVQSGAFRGFPASGKTLEWQDMVVSRFEDGLIAEEWATTDLAEHLLSSRRH